MILVHVTTKLQNATTNKILLMLQKTTAEYHFSPGFYYNYRTLLQLQNTTKTTGYNYSYRILVQVTTITANTTTNTIPLELLDTTTGYYYNC